MQNITSSLLRSYMAKWSFPYNSPFSNLSKIIEPMSDVVNSNIEKCANLINLRYHNNKLDCVENLYSVNTYGKTPNIIGEFYSITNKDGTTEYSKQIKLKYVGNYDNLSFFQFPIKGCHLEYKFIESGSLISKEAGEGEVLIDHTLPEASHIYITPIGTINEGDTCWIYGNNKDGEIITEQVLLINEKVAFESMFKYKSLVKVVSNVPVKISSYIDLKSIHSYESFTSFPKRMTNNDGNYIMPYLGIEDKAISIYDTSSIVQDPKIHFDTSEQIKAAFITGSMDIITLNESGWIVTYKPEFMTKYMKNVNGSLNKSGFIYVDDERSRIGDPITVTIYPYKTSQRFECTQLKISVENEDSVLYLNKEGMLTRDSNTWVRVADMNETVRLRITCENSLPYIFRIVTDSGEELIASAYQEEGNENAICGNVDDIIIYNQNLYAKRGDDYFLFSPRRMITMKHGSSHMVTEADYKLGDMVWVCLK